MAENALKATWKQKLGLISYKALCFVLRLTDVRLVALIGRGVGYLVWAASASRRRIVARNLRIVIDPALRPDKLASMVRRNMVRTSMNLACSLKTGLMTDREAERSIRMEGAEVFEEGGLGGHTVISCIPHAGNWEILARIRPYFKRVEHFGSMYRRMSNPLLEQMVYESRTAYGCEMFSKEDGLRAVLRLARTGGLLGVLSDQFTQEGLFLPYFGKVTGVTPLPALLYKRCKGKAKLFSVFTRNTGLGKWDAVLGRVIGLPEGCDSLAGLTMQVNLALEACQKENILDGFWMHHRWKATAHFAPEQDEEVSAMAAAHALLPFRIIICMPGAFEEAITVLPALRVLKARRADIQLNVLCPTEQQAFWQAQPEVHHAATTDGATGPVEQLEADGLYKDGPYDILFMFSEDARTLRQLRRLRPLPVSGFAENRLSKRFNMRASEAHCAEPRHRSQDYLDLLRRSHAITPKDESHLAPRPGNTGAQGDFIAPFSTLGSADNWPQENWRELAEALPARPTLLALPRDRDAAEAMAQELGLPCLCVQPEELAAHLGPGCRLFAVDGLLPQLAGACGAQCRVIMASRLAARYSPMGEGHRCFTNHVPCHPCYRESCDAATPCAAGVGVAELLA